MTDRMRQLAEDLAASSEWTVAEAVDALREALSAEVPPLSRLRKYPWYVRWLPGLWRQRWALRAIRRAEEGL